MTIYDEDDLEMPFELPHKADRKPKPMEWPLLPELPGQPASPAHQLRPLAPLTRFSDDLSWTRRSLTCSVAKGMLEIEEHGQRCASVELFWSRVCSGRPSSATREAYNLDSIDMVVLVRPSVRCRHSQSQEQWSFSCRRVWLPYILHYLASEGAVLEKDVENCFRLEGSCGKGGYGTIRRGSPVASEYYSPCKVAVKVAAEKDVRHELRMLVSAGRHPSVIQHHGAFRGAEQGRGPWSLILEFYPEGDLWHFCTDSLNLHLALSLLHNLLLGLQHIHSRKIFHRDVKPENILVSCERAILCDFGVAELLSESMFHRHARGLTPQYASPEMVATNSMNMTGDVYAAGATFHFMITLQYVSTSIKKKWASWWHSSEPELCLDHAPLNQLPVSCQDLLQRMICPERRRLTAKEAVRHYAFWSLADPEDEDTGVSSRTSAHFFPPSGDASAPLTSVPLSFFGASETLGIASANLKPVTASAHLKKEGTGSETSSRRRSLDSNSSKPSSGSEFIPSGCQQVVEEHITLDESVEALKFMLHNCPPEPPQRWWRVRRKPRPPGVKAPRAKRTTFSHWISQQIHALHDGMPHPPKRPSRVEPEPIVPQAGGDFVQLE